MLVSMSLIDRLSGVMGCVRAGMLLRDGADPMDAWEGHYWALSVGEGE